MQEYIKEALKDMAKFKESKIWKSLYFKCFICEEIKPIAFGTLLESMPVANFTQPFTIEQCAEVCCLSCVELLPKAPVFEK